MCLDVPNVEDKATWDKLRAAANLRRRAQQDSQGMNAQPILLALGVVLFVVGLGVSYCEWASGIQPWGQLLGDNFLFARSLPFTIGLGIVVGFWRASGWRWGTERRASDGAIRRFAPSTVWLHALAGVALVALIATGGWQYLKGLLDADTPVYMGTVYRIHYIAASLLIFATVAVRDRLVLRGEREPDRRQRPGHPQRCAVWRTSCRKPLGSVLGYLLGPGPAARGAADRAVHVLRAHDLLPAVGARHRR